MLTSVLNSYIATAGFRATEQLTIFMVSPSATCFDCATTNKIFHGESFVQVWMYFFHTCRLCNLFFLELSDPTGTCDTLRMCQHLLHDFRLFTLNLRNSLTDIRIYILENLKFLFALLIKILEDRIWEKTLVKTT